MVFSTNKTDKHNIAEKLLKVATTMHNPRCSFGNCNNAVQSETYHDKSL
jgi:hypothetical protein